VDLAGRVDRLLAARDGGTTIPRDPDLDLDTAYQVAAEVERRLVERGHVRVGRKIGFTNRATWDRHGLDRPIWAPVYDSTLTRTTTPAVGHLPEPRLEPEVVLGLGPDLSIAWAALGVEIVASHHAGWRFSPAEAVADFGVHAALVLGPSLPTGGLEELEVTLSGPSSSTGRGADVLGGPARALEALAELPGARPLREGEVVTTGTLVAPRWIEPGQRWTVRVTDGPEMTVETR
jgi:2-keto-4-pentenoate hydratase